MTDRLILRHLGAGDHGERLVVTRASDHIDSSPVEVQSPMGFPVEGQGQRDLMQELRWYLEGFLNYPFEPWETRAQRLLAARQRWGAAAFDALFHGGLGRDFYIEAVRNGADQLVLEIRSDDPKVLAWPWESLEDTATGVPLAVGCQIERRLTKLAQPPALAEGLPRDRLRILLVIARPYKADIGFRSIARPLVEQIEAEQFPAEVTVLRPPTFKRLQEVLEQNPDTFHILHFDGHGGYGSAADGSGTPHQYKGPEGRLVFENHRGEPAPVEASKLSALLARYKLPAVVLNACQSAMLDERAEDPFASVAAALLRGGVRSVVAMAYSLYVSAAQVFLPAFYKRLFETGDIGRATQDGRRRMFDQRKRVCVRGKFELEDWLIPVLYQQAKLDLSFVQAPAQRPETEGAAELPRAARDTENPYGFVGRDSALLALERAMRRKPAGILVHGLGGVGKTTLARGFVNWLAQTRGLEAGVLWVDFRDVRSAEYVVNEMLGPLAGAKALALPLEVKLEELTGLLRDNRVMVVWDNLESARGIEGSVVEGWLPAEDQQTLAKLLERLRGGKSKVLFTSRSEERWLGGPQTCTRLALGGLSGEERWTFCQVILDDLGLAVDRDDPNQIALMDKLGGHPLLMRAVLPKLESMTAATIAKVVESNLTAVVDGEDDLGAKVLATLAFVEQALPRELVPLLVPLSLHEHFVQASILAAMGAEAPGNWSQGRVHALLSALTTAGVVTRRKLDTYELHPALTTFLRARVAGDNRADVWQRGFVRLLGKMADTVVLLELDSQRPVFAVHGANFRRALALAKMLQIHTHIIALTQSLAAYAQNTRDFATARLLFEELAQHTTYESPAYHHLGVVAYLQRDFDTAERWFRKSIAIAKKQGNEHEAAGTYHHLGMMAEERRDFDSAEHWYLKAAAMDEKRGNEREAALTYHQLGNVAKKRRDFDAAEHWYGKSLAISKRKDDEHAAAGTYHQLGSLAEERNDIESAETWYREAIAIFEQKGDQQNATIAYSALGGIAATRRDFEAAERWCGKSLAIREKHGDEHGAAAIYHQLGNVAYLQQDFETAERWYRKALAVFEKRNDEHDLAVTYHQLGEVATEQRNFEAAELWCRKSLAIKEKYADERGVASSYHQLGVLAQERGSFEAAEHWFRNSLAIDEKQGNERGAASTYYHLGVVAAEQGDFKAAAASFVRAATAFKRLAATQEHQIVTTGILHYFANVPDESKAAFQETWKRAGLEWPHPQAGT